MNKCSNLRYRKQKGIIYQVCIKQSKKGQINDNICYMCPFKEYKTYNKLKSYTKMVVKTKKQAKLENKRYSILTDDLTKCYLCHNLKNDIHEIYAGAYRITSIKNGFCIPICRKCHQEIQNNEEKMLQLKMACQLTFEETHTREEFIELIKQNYIKD